MTREHWLPAAPESAATARTLVREAAGQAGLDGERIFDLTLAATEAVANAITHGDAWPNGCILLTTEPCSRGLQVEVCDCGTFDAVLEPASLDATSGRGIQIIATLVDRLDVQSRDGLTRVRFEKHRMQVVPNLRRPLIEQAEKEMQRSARVAG
jgi:anti-sigma regulatory factor (Ser/Thr protein kinase)